MVLGWFYATPLTYDITTLQMWKYLVGKLTLLLRIQYKPNHFGKPSRVVTILMLHTELRTCITIFGDSHLLGCDASLVTWFLTFQRVLPSFSGVKKSKKNGSSETPWALKIKIIHSFNIGATTTHKRMQRRIQKDQIPNYIDVKT